MSSCTIVSNIKSKRRRKWNPRRITSDYKSTTSGSAYKHGVLNKIVDHVKSSYMSGEEIMYSFEDLLRKANLGTLLEPVKEWLRAEGLPQCQRIKCTLYVDGLTRYEYAPPLPCRTQDKLIEFLKKRRKESGTGSLKEDILLSVPNAERVLQVIRDEICIFSRHDQKEVVFYSPKNERVETVPALTNLVPEVSVFAINDEKVDGILEDGGFFISQPSNCDAKKRSSDVRVSRRSRGVKRSAFKHNSHVNSLQLYS